MIADWKVPLYGAEPFSILFIFSKGAFALDFQFFKSNMSFKYLKELLFVFLRLRTWKRGCVFRNIGQQSIC